MSLVATIIWAAVACYAITAISMSVERYSLQRWPMIVSRDELIRPGTANQVEIPDDIVALAMTESEEWAQEHILNAARDRYGSLKDWNKVRKALGIGSVD